MASTKDARAAIERHLYECEPAAGMKYQSSLIAILGDARGAADRDGEGRVKPNKRSQSWLGATAYLILLDQVGKTFKVKWNTRHVRPSNRAGHQPLHAHP